MTNTYNDWDLDSEAEEVVVSEEYMDRYIEGNQAIVIAFQRLNERQKIFYGSMCNYLDEQEDSWEVMSALKLLMDRLTLQTDLDKLSNTIH